MAIQHTCKIERILQLNDNSGTISVICVNIESSDGDFTATFPVIVNLNTENIQNFIQYEDLTEETVLNWVKDYLGSENISKYELMNEQDINNQKNSSIPEVIEKNLPWSQE